MQLVVQVACYVVVGEWRCDDAVHNDKLFFRDDGLQPFRQGGGHHGDPLLSSHCQHAVIHRHLWGVLERQRWGRAACTCWKHVTLGHLDVSTASSGDVHEHGGVTVGAVRHEHHLREGNPARGICCKHSIACKYYRDLSLLPRFQIDGLGSSETIRGGTRTVWRQDTRFICGDKLPLGSVC